MGARELQALLREVKNVRSPVQRMKLITLAWRTVARLTPGERRELGAQVGVQGFEHLLETLGSGPAAITPVEILRALDGAEDLGPSTLDRLVRGLRDPEQRRELLRHGLDAIGRHLSGPEPVDVTATDGADRAEAPEKATELIVDPAALRPAALGADRAINPEPEPMPPAGSAPSPEVAATETEPVEAPAAVAEAAPGSAEDVDTVAEPEPTAPEPVRSPAASPARWEWSPPAPPPSDAPPDAGAPQERRPSLIARFRAFRRTLDQPDEWSATRVRTLLFEFPDGWARRRAVTWVLQQGHYEDVDDALSFIEALEHPRDRWWACATLIRAGRLHADHLDRLFEHAPVPSLVRRMRRRSPTSSR